MALRLVTAGCLVACLIGGAAPVSAQRESPRGAKVRKVGGPKPTRLRARRRPSKAKIAPSVLAADLSRIGQEVRRVTRAGADEIHVDIMDGVFVKNRTFGAETVRVIRENTHLPLHLHLMTTEPDATLQAFADAGADALWVHAEASTDLPRTIRRIRELGLKAGVAISPATPPEILRDVLGDLDTVLVMSVNPGAGGQPFMPSVLPKIRTLRLLADEQKLQLRIAVDGGINERTIASAARAGADVFVAGTAVFGRPSYRAAIGDLRQRATKASRSRRRARPAEAH